MKEKIISAFLKEMPNREVVFIGDLGKGEYLVVAPGKGMGGADSTNPVYSFNSSTGDIERFNIMGDRERYLHAVNNVLYDNRV